MKTNEQIITLDQRKRIPLGKLLKFKDVDFVKVKVEGDGTIIIFPMSAVPAKEKWLWENPKALASVKKGLTQKARNNLGSFAQYTKD